MRDPAITTRGRAIIDSHRVYESHTGNAGNVEGYVDENGETWCPDCIRGVVGPLDSYEETSPDSLHPLFGDTESLSACCHCDRLLDTLWGPYEVNYARELITDGIEITAGGHRFARKDPSFTMDLAEHLRWCHYGFAEAVALARYDRALTAWRADTNRED